ncbi:hypothetical protein ACJZ2D_015320 [Fusarium nematophilum]
MAAPQTKTTRDLNGDWILNKDLSDSSEPVLRAQGIGYLARKGVALATIHLNIRQHDAAALAPSSSTGKVTCIESTQTASGLKTTKETRHLDNEFRDHSDWLFGVVKARARWASVEEIDDGTLKDGWLIEGEKSLVLSYVVSQGNGWTATQVWGFQLVQGERRYCMRVLVVSKQGESVQARFVYDHQP